MQNTIFEKKYDMKTYNKFATVLLFFVCLLFFSSSKAQTTGEKTLKEAEVLVQKGQYVEAEKAIIPVLATLPNTPTPTLANLQRTLASCQLEIGRNDMALENYSKALQIYRQLYGENRDEVADCYNHLGIVYWNTGNNEQALEYLNKALAIRKALYLENHAEVAASYNNIGLVYAAKQPLDALEYYEKAIEIYKKVYPENHPTVANTYNNVAIIQRGQQQYEEALINFDKALTIRKLVYEKDHPTEAFTYLSVGQVHTDMGNFDKALENFEKALKIYQKNYGQKHPEIAQTYNLLGTLFLKRNDYKQAIAYFQQALVANVADFQALEPEQNPAPKNYYNGNALLNSFLLKAQAHESRHFQKTLKFKDLKIALQTLETADALLEELRRKSKNKNDKIALSATASEIYEDAIRLCTQMADVTLVPDFYFRKAFDFAEKSKSAALLSAISDAQAKEFAGLPTDVLENERELTAEIAFYEQQANSKKQEEQLASRNKLFELNRKYEELIKDLEQKYPEYYNLKYNVKNFDIEQIQQNLDNETAMISYFIAEKQKRLYIFEVTNKKFKSSNIALDENFNNNLTILRNAIVYKVQDVYIDVANKLYAQLLAPIAIPSQIKHLIFVPDGRLGIIPFEVLLTKTSQAKKSISYANLPYLVRDYAISYAYSGTLLVQNIQKMQKANVNKGTCLIAPVQFANAATLKDSEKEVNEIAKINPEASIFLEQKAQESLLKTTQISQYRFLHFATHGFVDENIPEKSGILLSKDLTGKEDGTWYLGEIYNTKLNADLITLSACQTGLGKISRGEGIIGLTRALLYAGAKNMVVSFWKVADNSTSKIMVDFYSNFAMQTKQMAFSKSLQEAKLKMIQESKFAAPYYWSAFVLIGK